MIKGIAFDMDGLMFDTESLAIKGWLSAGKQYGFPITKDMVIATFGYSYENTRLMLEEYLGKGFPFKTALQARLDYAQKEIEQKGVPVKPGLRQLLAYLQENNYSFTIATSSDEKKVRGYLEKTGLSDAFAHIVCGDSIAYGKPAPDIYLKAASILGLPPEHCIALEDSPAGILSAYRAGMKPVMVPDIIQPNEETAKLLYGKVDSLEAVIPLLEKANKQ